LIPGRALFKWYPISGPMVPAPITAISSGTGRVGLKNKGFVDTGWSFVSVSMGPLLDAVHYKRCQTVQYVLEYNVYTVYRTFVKAKMVSDGKGRKAI
jgi:hypothetical protein